MVSPLTDMQFIRYVIQVGLSIDEIADHVQKILRSGGIADKVRDNYQQIKNNNRSRELFSQISASSQLISAFDPNDKLGRETKSDTAATTETMHLLCSWGLEHAGLVATQYAKSYGGTNEQQIGSAIMAATYAHSFFSSWNCAHKLKPVALCCQHAAKKASDRCELQLL